MGLHQVLLLWACRRRGIGGSGVLSAWSFDVVRLVFALGQDPGLDLVEFVLDNYLRHPIQSELIWPRRGSLLSLVHWLLLVSAVRKPFSFLKAVRCLEDLWGLVLLKIVLA